jgi:glycine C-acetyltransferase/8-amino-7-oxononanoate synthase
VRGPASAGPQGPSVTVAGGRVLLLCSGNYLGLADHPRVREAAIEAITQWGVGAGGAPLASGNMEPHRRLESRLASFSGYQSALLFGSSYLANAAAITALSGSGQIVFADAHNHAGIAAGCRLSSAQTSVYPHGDLDQLERSLQAAEGRAALIISAGVFSIEGDIAPVADLLALARRYDCRLIVDEADATGAIGPGGRGTVAAAGLSGEVDLVVGALDRALGGYGAYLCGASELIESVIAQATPIAFSAALPPPVIGAAIAALELLEQRPTLPVQLQQNATVLGDALRQEGLDAGAAESQIIVLDLGSPELAAAVCEAALDAGIYTQVVHHPTAPESSSQLRLTVMSTHLPEQLRWAAETLAKTVDACRLRLDSRAPELGAGARR